MSKFFPLYWFIGYFSALGAIGYLVNESEKEKEKLEGKCIRWISKPAGMTRKSVCTERKKS